MRAALLAAISALSCGCATVIVDDEGRRHIVGLVWLTLPAAAVGPVGAETLRTRSVGITLMHGPQGSSALLGYGDHSLTTIRNDAAVRLPAADPPARGERP